MTHTNLLTEVNYKEGFELWNESVKSGFSIIGEFTEAEARTNAEDQLFNLGAIMAHVLV